MTFTVRELWAAFHGMGLGAVYLLMSPGIIYIMWSLKPGWATENAAATQVIILKAGTLIMAVINVVDSDHRHLCGLPLIQSQTSRRSH